MAAPAFDPSADAPRAVPLREARNRLTQLVAFAELTDAVTMITRDGDPRPVAAIVPAQAARTAAQARAEDDRVRAVTAGWARRLDAMHDRSARMHAAELRALTDALAQAWAELDRRVPPGVDPALTRLRAAHTHLLAEAGRPEAGSKHTDAGSKHPDAGSKHPDAGSKHPDAGNEQTDAGNEQPEGTTRTPPDRTPTTIARAPAE